MTVSDRTFADHTANLTRSVARFKETIGIIQAFTIDILFGVRGHRAL